MLFSYYFRMLLKSYPSDLSPQPSKAKHNYHVSLYLHLGYVKSPFISIDPKLHTFLTQFNVLTKPISIDSKFSFFHMNSQNASIK